MRPHQARFVTVCQQSLALAAVLAVLTPAASVVSLDVLERPGTARQGAVGADQELARPGTRQAQRAARPASPDADDTGRHTAAPGQDEVAPESTVPAGSVQPTVTEVPLTPAADPGRERPEDEPERARRSSEPSPRSVVSAPQPVEGYGAVGVTWSSEERVEHDGIRLEVRTLTAGEWSGWTALEYHDDHAPDPTSSEGQHARPGTDPLLVGEVDQVQARAVADTALPADLSLAVVFPGEAAAVTEEAPELTMDDQAGAAGADGAAADPDGTIELQAASSAAPQPTIYSRKQWGADERLRDGSPSYGTISAGFVHHTVNANDYTRAEVPGIIRSIYAYHTRSRGWSDIGYNFLVDKFGRIWEGRAGGISRPVIGAHTYGYNDDSFAMSAIGNFETVRPPEAMLKAYGALFAWKLGLHGIDPMDTSQRVSGSTFKAINGHRDAGSTACPGRYLYAQLPEIRELAAAAASGSGALEQITVRQVDSDLAATPHPDLVVRRASDGRGMVVPTGGLTWFAGPSVVEQDWQSRAFLAVPDLTGDDRGDVVTFDDTGSLEIRPGLPEGGVGEVVRRVRRFRGHDVIASTGDLNGDGRPDFVGRAGGRLVAFLGTPRGSFRPVSHTTGLRGYRQLVGAGDVTGDGRVDLWGRHHRGMLYLHRGLGGGRFSSRIRVAGDWSGYHWLVGGVDHTGDSLPDLVARRADGSLMLFASRPDGTLAAPTGPVRRVSGLSWISGAGQVVGDEAPDLLAVGSDGTLVVLRNRGTFDLGRPIDTGRSFGRGNRLLNAGDLTGDGHGDVIMRRKAGSLWLYRGTGTGRLGAPTWVAGRSFRGVSDLRVVADVTGDDRPDLLGVARDGQPKVWPITDAGRLLDGYAVDVTGDLTTRVDRSRYDWVIATPDLQRRGPADLLVRDVNGYLHRLDGTRSGLRAPRRLGEATAYDLAGG